MKKFVMTCDICKKEILDGDSYFILYLAKENPTENKRNIYPSFDICYECASKENLLRFIEKD
jgi:hypothetical protein